MSDTPSAETQIEFIETMISALETREKRPQGFQLFDGTVLVAKEQAAEGSIVMLTAILNSLRENTALREALEEANNYIAQLEQDPNEVAAGISRELRNMRALKKGSP